MVLNKIDAMIDPLATPEQVAEQIERQRTETAHAGRAGRASTPLSARQALAARVENKADALAQSRLPALETALGGELMPRVAARTARARGDRRRAADRDARGAPPQRQPPPARRADARSCAACAARAAAKLQMMLQRVDAETAEFEACTTAQLQAMRVVHSRMLQGRDGRPLVRPPCARSVGDAADVGIAAEPRRQGPSSRCASACATCSAPARRTRSRSAMLEASFNRLNAEFGFGLVLNRAGPRPLRRRARPDREELRAVPRADAGAAPVAAKFMEQFRRMLMSKLRVVFENASAELEMWNKSASAQVDAQLRERRRNFRRRRESLERIQAAASELETRLEELDAQDQRLRASGRCIELIDALRQQVRTARAACLARDAHRLPAGRFADAA